jgi:ABC-type molybdate transport system substrate-binding protein
MSEDKKHPHHDLDLDAKARIALSEARAMPPGPERREAMKKAGILRNAADAQKISFARRGRPPKD